MTNHSASGAETSVVSLLPCPFCGSVDEQLVQAFTRATDTFAYWSVECLECGCEIASDESQREADQHWNTRLTSTPQAASATFLAAIHERTPTGAWIAVQHHPDGDWSVAHHPLPWLPGGQVAASPECPQAASAEVREVVTQIVTHFESVEKDPLTGELDPPFHDDDAVMIKVGTLRALREALKRVQHEPDCAALFDDGPDGCACAAAVPAHAPIGAGEVEKLRDWHIEQAVVSEHSSKSARFLGFKDRAIEHLTKAVSHRAAAVTVKSWAGGERAPADWNGGPCLLLAGCVQSEVSEGNWIAPVDGEHWEIQSASIVAYTPAAAPTGNADAEKGA